MIFNSHAHLMPDPQRSDEYIISHLPVEQYVRHCLAQGVTRAAVCTGIFEPKLNPNKAVIEQTKRFPDFFKPLAFVALGVDEPEVVTRYHEMGFAGLKIIGPAYAYDDPRAFEYYRRAEDHKMPILFHTGWVAPAFTAQDAYVNCDFMRPLCLDTVCRRFPKLNCIGAHLGNYLWEEAIYLSTRHENLFFDLSGGSVRHKSARWWRDAFSTGAKPNLESEEEVLNLKPFEHFVYGSDNPKPEVLLTFYRNLMRLLGVPEETQKKVYWGNAARMFGL